MNGWTFIVVGAILLTAGGILGTQGWNMLKKREEAFALSIRPSLEVSTRNSADAPTLLTLQNTGQHDLIDIEICPVSYRLKHMEIEQRTVPSATIPIVKSLTVGESYSMSTEPLVFTPDEWLRDGTGAVAFVIIYRRKDDNKRFVDIEPYIATEIEGQKILMALYAGKGDAMGGGSVQKHYALMRQIVEMERFFFRSDDK
jgi:hypothetical protein